MGSSEHFQPLTPTAFAIPTFGPHSTVHLERKHRTEFVLKAMNLREQDFGWICTQMMEQQEQDLQDMGIDLTDLESIVHRTLNPQETTRVASSFGGTKRDLLLDETLNVDTLKHLRSSGYAVLDVPALKVSPEANELLSNILVDKTTQHVEVRSDSVAFLDKSAATECLLKGQYDFLVGVASHFNQHHHEVAAPTTSAEDESAVNVVPIAPATKELPFTNPPRLQAAQYRQGEFYVAHSDNPKENANIRTRYRFYTCILYCNQSYQEGDGGALRIYLNSHPWANTDGEIPLLELQRSCEWVDVEPRNGRVVIFESQLVHSVEPVMQSRYARQALTLW
eukprot:CAMPEP_0194045496 /NCGR_PEP_ID=MMETSP0009_2-20130614/16820_1 /TAXON_ID=210454 /ORGANISM="Grammatophora oceanica, Strain CCMP 410" /LENGTH=336 /DNA_ID=CAMNT_0038690361 /DNA_START=12 /DNA_END=1019 /DNA_ORIENTATION=+